jgi:hypothetical protein
MPFDWFVWTCLLAACFIVSASAWFIFNTADNNYFLRARAICN